MYKIKKGDAVRIKTNLIVGNDYGCYFTKDMEKYKGQIFTVYDELYIDKYTLIGAGNFVYSPEMLELISDFVPMTTKEIASRLGLEIGEEFNVHNRSWNPHVFTDTTLIDRNGTKSDELIGNLLTGKETFEKIPQKPWKPKKGEWYWYVTISGEIKSWCYNDDLTEFISWSLGIMFKNEKEAAKNYDAVMKKYADIREEFENG